MCLGGSGLVQGMMSTPEEKRVHLERNKAGIARKHLEKGAPRVIMMQHMHPKSRNLESGVGSMGNQPDNSADCAGP